MRSRINIIQKEMIIFMINNYNIDIQKASGLSKEKFQKLTAGQKLAILRSVYLYINNIDYKSIINN